MIDIAEENVRKSKREQGIEELKASIAALGLIQPIVLLPNGDRYKLLVGQRRYLAFQALGVDKIPSLIIEQPITSDQARLISFGENNHRRKLPYSDTIIVCDILFRSVGGSKTKKIEIIAQRLNIHPRTVSKYLAYQLVPKPVQALVENGKLTPDMAYRLTGGFWPNVEMIIDVAKEFTELTKAERERLIAARKRNPSASIQDLMNLARQPIPGVELIIHIEPETMDQLKTEAKERKTEVDPLVNTIIEEWLEEEGQIDKQ